MHGNGVPIVKMSTALKFHFCRLLCAKNAVSAPNVSNSSNFPGLYPETPIAGAHPTPTFSHVLLAVRPSASVPTLSTS